MPLSEFLRKRLQAYADNTIPTLLIAGGSFVVGWVIQGYGQVWGLDLKVANVLAWLVALIVAIALSALLKPKNKPDQLEPSEKQQLAPPTSHRLSLSAQPLVPYSTTILRSRFGASLPPSLKFVTPRPHTLGYVGLLKGLLTFQNFGNVLALYLPPVARRKVQPMKA